jgi:hypothetical protein
VVPTRSNSLAASATGQALLAFRSSTSMAHA